MRRPKDNARRQPGVSQSKYQYRNHSPRRWPLQRAAAQWLLDAVTLIHDGDERGARQAARTALKALHRKGAA